MAGADGGYAGGGGVLSRSVEAYQIQVERLVVLQVGVEGAVEKVEALKAQLELLIFVDFEVLEDANLVVEVGGAVDVGEAEGAVMAFVGGGEAGGVEVLVGLEALARIAGDEGNSGFVGGSVDGVVADSDAGTDVRRDLVREGTVDADDLVSAILVVVGTVLGNVGEGCAGAVLLDAGDAPAIEDSVEDFVVAEVLGAEVGRMM